MQRPLIILGTGGGARDVLEIAGTHATAWRVVGFLDDAQPAGTEHAGLPVLGRIADAPAFPGHVFVTSIGSDTSYRGRPHIIAASGLDDDCFATLVHAGAFVSPRARLGAGTSIGFGASIAAGVEIGRHVTIGAGVVIGHDTVIADHAVLAPAAVVSGAVRLGRACYIGAGACLRQRLAVGAEALVGIGTVVLRNVPAGATVVGNPARVLRRPAARATVQRQPVHEALGP
jgi:sugar O-acyltransferase (sialic acid O-acetyltransferase NeuD family)